MRKIAVILAALLAGVPALFAQSPFDYAGRWNFSVQGGLAVTVSDNVFGYTDNGMFKDLLKLQGAAAIGYDFTSAFGVRIAGGYAQHAGSSNILETGSKNVWPFTYQSIFGFADALLHVNGLVENYGPFAPSFYAGLGAAKTYGFTNPNHPFQNPHDPNLVLGFRAGFIAEVDFQSGLGLFCDLGLEAYDDWHNGIRPSNIDQSRYKGYAGFPFDLVGKLSLGIIYHFK
jgi:hypothetical protein